MGCPPTIMSGENLCINISTSKVEMLRETGIWFSLSGIPEEETEDLRKIVEKYHPYITEVLEHDMMKSYG